LLRHQLGHLEHRNLLLAAEHRLQLFVGIDQALVDRVLQLVLLDVIPDLLRDFGARQRGRADDGFLAAAFFAAGFLVAAFLAAGFFAAFLAVAMVLLCLSDCATHRRNL